MDGEINDVEATFAFNIVSQSHEKCSGININKKNKENPELYMAH